MSDALFEAVCRTPAAQALLRRLEEGGVCTVVGICQPAQAFLATLLRRQFPARPILVVADFLKTQESLQQELETWNAILTPSPAGKSAEAPCLETAVPARSVLFHPAWEIMPHEAKLPHADVISDRLECLGVLNDLAEQTREPPLPPADRLWPIINATVVALMQRTFPPEALRRRTLTMVRGQRMNPLDLVEWLEDQGYEPELRVSKKGELSMRGGLVDVFPPTSPWPVRLEFFGEDLDSLRYFDPASQVSRQAIERVVIPPAGELGILRREISASPPDTAIQGGLATLLDYLPASTIAVLCEPANLRFHAESYAAQIPPHDPFFIAWSALQESLQARGTTVLELQEMAMQAPPRDPSEEGTAGRQQEARSPFVLELPSLEAFRPLGGRAPEPQVADAQRREFFAQMHRWLRREYEVHLFCNNAGEEQRFGEIWAEYGLDSASAGEAQPGGTPAPGAEASVSLHGPATVPSRALKPQTHVGTLSRGFLCEEARLAVVTDAEIFGRYKVQRPRRLRSPHAAALRSALDIDFAELEEGDYVVHLQHGIGRYRGLRTLPGSEAREGQAGEECLVIEYAPREPDQPAPKLYVPVSEAHLVSKYVGSGKARPPLNALGGNRWSKTKARTELAVRDLAGGMLAIQAARETEPGHAFGPDAPWQREFESAFVFEETPDQLRAIHEVKADMEKAKPMDRLICGDVGFGKTEVAIRAAFKAVLDGRQVAVLVPTTVLAQQHYNTFRERMADYPVRIELLSRFRTRMAQLRVARELATGAVDIVIGTHRLVQPDIAFKDLGLVIIDEEQRFGVAHKERFKQLRRLVDVLTLSATPIPRTLHLALVGARDMSTIQTPPHDRLPVETIVTPYDERVIRDAIRRELNRGGQVFFLHNRVLTIQDLADKLRILVPEARIEVGHGQMHSDELEEVMTRFVNGEADVLLSTTIIESGLDIPNANTIIIDRADRFGLSDLYQLRGRVGRYKHQAYAYLIIPRHARLLTDARKRISALKQYSTLGSGFKIALRDLEIRGAGNLLGAEQSGHITAVGFDLYCQLLKNCVARLKGEKVREPVQVQLHLDFIVATPLAEGVRRGASSRNAARQPRKSGPDFEVAVPRDTWTYAEADGGSSAQEAQEGGPARPAQTASASIPLSYVNDPVQRIEVYRKLAQATETAELDALQSELRDRFGPVPAAVELLLLTAEIKLLAAERGLTTVETKLDKLMLTRGEDYVTIAGKFPRMKSVQPKARLREIRKVLLALKPITPTWQT